MRYHAVGAILDSIFICVVSSAVFKKIKRTVTKQTVELVGIFHIMAWKILALFMPEKLIIFTHDSISFQFSITQLLGFHTIARSSCHQIMVSYAELMFIQALKQHAYYNKSRQQYPWVKIYEFPTD